MRAAIYEGPVRFTKFFMVDLFGDSLVEISEDDFNDLVVSFRDCFKREYIEGGQKFINVNNPCDYYIRLY